MSKCPVDHKQITKALKTMNKLLELPWKPLYTQSGGASSNGDSTLAYWSLAATVAFTVIVYAFEGSLDARQKASYQKTEFPKELETTVSKIDSEREKETDKKEGESAKSLLEQLKEKFKSSQAYGLDKINFGMFSSTYDTFESVALLLLGFLPYLWDISVDVGKAYFSWTAAEDEIKISLIFLGLVTIVGTITSLPFELYSTFNIEKKHGFNKQTLGLFFTDKIKSLVLTGVIGGPFLALLLKIIEVNGIINERLHTKLASILTLVSSHIDGWRLLLHLCLGIYVFLLSIHDDNCASCNYASVQQVRALA